MESAQETSHRIDLLDSDPLRSRREARELVAEFADAGLTAVVQLPEPQAPDGEAKGVPVLETVSVLLAAGSLGVAVLQTWLARSPGRTIRVVRADGAQLEISGREVRQDSELVERFLGERAEQAEQAGQAERSEQAGQAERAERAGRSERAERAGNGSGSVG
ncbi:hypothetical protein [Kitasatospora sp. NPDC002040]|uniref:effector-associated constant component EACC1 n=1 Tax=Kitasatospora sp. NPDC002040 TaxID=3154661 RepID=UPI00331F2624